MTHDQAAGLLTEFLQGRIAGTVAEEISAHVKGCAECASVSETYRLLQAGAGSTKNSSDTAHPTTEEISTFTLVPNRLDDTARRRLEKHVAKCASCAEEIEITREAAAAAAASTPSTSSRAASRWNWPSALALAASLTALILAYPALRGIRDLPALEAETSRLGEENRRLSAKAEDLRRSLAENQREDEARESWSGAVPLVVLSAPSRGESPSKTICVKDGQPGILLAVLPPLPGQIPHEAEYQFNVNRDDGSQAWSTSMTPDAIRTSVKEAGVVTFLIPPPTLPPGQYTLSLREKDSQSSILDVAFVVAREGEPGSQCQSPAATNAPQ